ncbi:DUF4115 domain-containing protein [Lactobacillus sp. YT155]|uniref:helix-turn-helix domain-containing protein n=1 Tax=Lactobacillus sp. YT155 TaxID=3060955 RepID=UPI00265F008D|nr:helix-turn-helix domain-containing protein [Lactobacillus sp. YT155]MDO1605140.1 DUF4115 domain-containing protein [Lactobacillus sp. YT155]
MDEIGQRLRAARIEKGLTIDDIQQTTKIQKRYLIAIEEGQFDQLPGEFYVRAFMKQYAQAVGLDSRALLGDTVIEKPQTQPEPTEQPNNNDRAVSDSVNRELNKESKQKQKSRNSDRTIETIKNYLPQVIVIVLVVIIVGTIFTIANQNKANNQTVIPDDSKVVKEKPAKKKTTPKKDTEKKETEAKFSLAEDENTPGTFTIKNLPATGNKLVVSASGANSWVEVTIDDKSTWAGSIPADQQQDIEIPEGAKKIQVHSGNSKVLSMKVNDTEAKVSDLTTGGSVRTFIFNIQ